MTDETRDLVVIDVGSDEAWTDDEDGDLTVLAPEDESDLGWYRCVVADKFFKIGAVVYVTQRLRVEDGFATDEVMVRRGGMSWRYAEASFEQHFDYDPQGQLHRQQEIAELMQAMENLLRQPARSEGHDAAARVGGPKDRGGACA